MNTILIYPFWKILKQLCKEIHEHLFETLFLIAFPPSPQIFLKLEILYLQNFLDIYIQMLLSYKSCMYFSRTLFLLVNDIV